MKIILCSVVVLVVAVLILSLLMVYMILLFILPWVFLLFFCLVVEIDGMGAAISTFHLHIPTAFVDDQAVTAAAGALFQNDILFIHNTKLLI